ncbi:hypothetical protein BDZ94DRAFT_1249739 [Collybia nuda]|uniref:BPL/LPL catalytic domain-containing protein n=1 Tax=Collybia nuda TaxID=64659 RepID=A0A9P6CIB6_9AGAR|nr:hypothetical protein BDZ94DRAFT_1249739 [Collybia nuda]
MDVLVYSGPEVLPSSLSHVLAALRAALLPHYAIQTITQQSLKSQPWTVSCALLVFPELREPFQSPSSSIIKDYVESGGSFLGFAAGATSSNRDSGGIAGISKDLQLRFYDKHTGAYIYPTPRLGSDHPRIVTLQTHTGEVIEGIYENGSNSFVGFESGKKVMILANYLEGDTNGLIAGLKCEISDGNMTLWAPNLENPLTEEPAASLLNGKDVGAANQRRLDLLISNLANAGLQLPSKKPETTIVGPLPQFLTSHPSKPTIVSKITDLIAAPSPGSQLSIFQDGNDTFHFHQMEESGDLVKDIREKSISSNDFNQPKHIIICTNKIPNREETPFFDLESYYEALTTVHKKRGDPSGSEPWGFGEAVLYGEVVTSTQTLLDKNPRFMSRLPTPLVSIASYQLAGRGRGGNIWLSQSGGLQFSTLLRVSLSSFPASKLVFVQYLFALAVVEACRDETVLGSRGGAIRLKWPNDLYAIFGPGEGDRKKIGGILVNTSFSGSNVDIVVGCGLNVLNAAPVFSLAQLLSPEEASRLSIERTVVSIITTFEKMWSTFVKERGSFDSFMNLYLERWLHSDQLVTLTTSTPSKQVRITGITPDHGLLRTMPERTGWSSEEQGYIDLQPDGNSFDLMAGLIKSKT